jgi:hypothetical protein
MPDETPAAPSPLSALAGKPIYVGVLAIGIIAMSLAGYVTVTTPEEQQCQIDLADASARLELLSEAKDACKAALESITRVEEATP